jgi:asparagine synthase (glutamine-hydrolysing)
MASVAEQMQGTLTHRGPDDRGLFISDDGHCALAHTRLSILDLSSAGHQPMGLGQQGAWSREHGARSMECGAWSAEQRGKSTELGAKGKGQRAKGKEQSERYWITYNGEIYNYRELRKELGARSRELSISDCELRISDLKNSQEQETGHGESQRSEDRGPRSAVTGQSSPVSDSDWQSNTDTEVILRAYARWGRDCVHHLRGMFVFALWDEQKQELFLARDPLGIKPLYCYQTDSLFVFASEVRALLASGLVSRKLSLDGVASYLQFGSVQDPLTIIDGVQSLLPGHSFVVRLEDRRLKTELFRYSSNLVRQTAVGVPTSRAEAVKHLRWKLEDSVRAHLVSDVPVGAFLSGGIDSTAIVALMSRVADQKPKTFSVVFKESEFSEAEHARLVAKTFGTEHQEIMLSEDRLLGMLPDALEAMDQPTMDGINAYVVSKAVKESGITVALSGLGGDELFGGYPSFRRATQLHRLAIAPFGLRRFVSLAGRAMLNGDARRRKFWELVESDCSPYAAYSLSRQLFAPNEISALLADLRPPTTHIRPHAPSSLLHATAGDKSAIRNPQSAISSLNASRFALSPLQHQDVINEVSRLELSGYMANTLLRDTDQMSMAHALEVRVPFIDPVVVSFVLGLPGEWKTNGRIPKPLLVDALGDSLPEEIWKRPKMGFTLPFQRWMTSGLQPDLERAFSRGDGFERFGLTSDRVRDVWATFKNNPHQEPWSRPWSLYVLAEWSKLNDVTA